MIDWDGVLAIVEVVFYSVAGFSLVAAVVFYVWRKDGA